MPHQLSVVRKPHEAYGTLFAVKIGVDIERLGAGRRDAICDGVDDVRVLEGGEGLRERICKGHGD